MSAESLRQEAKALLDKAEEIKSEQGDNYVENYTQAVADAAAKASEASELQTADDVAKAMQGDLAKPRNRLPSTVEEVEEFEPEADAKALKIKNSYKPLGWVKSLPSAIQPTWIRDHMGQTEKEEAEFLKRTWTKWFQSPHERDFWRKASENELKAMQEDTDTEGGFFVPEDYRDIVIHNVGVPGGIHRPACTVITTGLKDGYIPTFGTVTWAAIAEEATYGDNTPVVGQVSFTIRKSGGSAQVSRELLADSASNIPSLLSQVFGEAHGRYEDQQLIEGDGTTEAEGLRTTGTDGPDAAANTVIAIGDVHAWYFDLPAQFRGNARWSTTSSFMADIAGLQVTANKGDLSESPDSAMVGKPVLMFDGTGWDDATALAASEELGVIGDFSNYYLVDRVGMSLTRDDSIDVKTDQVWFGARVRGDGRVGLADAFRIMKLPA